MLPNGGWSSPGPLSGHGFEAKDLDSSLVDLVTRMLPFTFHIRGLSLAEGLTKYMRNI